VTAWTALVTDAGERRRLVELIAELATRGGAPAGTDDLCDVALLHAYLGEAIPDREDAGGAALSRAIAQLGVGGSGAALFGGAARVGWTVTHLADAELADRVAARIDEALSRALDDWTGDYDLIGGLAGIGVYALERGAPARALALRVLDHLEALARPRRDGVGWFTPFERLPASQRALAPDGYWNVGLAHGSAGVIGVLARYLRAEVEPARTRRLLTAAVDGLLRGEAAGGAPRFPRWYTDRPMPSPSSPPGLRWCYGDLGIAIAVLAAARAADDAAWYADGLALARSCAATTAAASGIRDPSLCHGAFGAAHLFLRMARATGDAALAAAARAWLDRGVAMVREPCALDRSLLVGTTGVALAIHAMTSDVEPLWDRLLLADL
jgi:hypothetical protein